MADAHLSIGEVLSLLQDEFPDITISKIRFLESQGLIDPERTPSGYRKFYETDIERLRWILVQQRENFLPLKVIKERLESGDGVTEDQPADAGSHQGEHPVAGVAAASGSGAHASMSAGGVPGRPPPIWMADVAASRSRGTDAGPADLGTSLDGEATEVSLTAGELAGAAGISLEGLRELERFGLVTGRSFGDDTYYDGDALLVATKSAAFIGHGIGARHLRMFKVSAEREAGFLEQVAMPLLKQRNPESRRQAVALVEELADLGHDLRTALLRANLRRHLDRT
jgi:DNA-binding transcriptional MerR regulator